jgi:hypothetical protein
MKFDYQAHTDLVLNAEHNAPSIGATFTTPAPKRVRPLSWLGRIMLALIG